MRWGARCGVGLGAQVDAHFVQRVKHDLLLGRIQPDRWVLRDRAAVCRELLARALDATLTALDVAAWVVFALGTVRVHRDQIDRH